MDGHQCIKCGRYWASQAVSPELRFIRSFCPICLPKAFPATLPPDGMG